MHLKVQKKNKSSILYGRRKNLGGLQSNVKRFSDIIGIQFG